jgi:hypothetical protein
MFASVRKALATAIAFGDGVQGFKGSRVQGERFSLELLNP